ncbi:uncharacterized protein VTP21DRAFT_9666 [Calcarisporiella thermophila]|uniref:uncharacterized protein n=1 Tax=Calcarisporiella thermophila TaxID=911321 RepID=UPI003743CA34
MIARETKPARTTALSEEQQGQLEDLLTQYEDIFEGLGRTTEAEHAIDTGDAAPIKCAPYRVSWEHQQVIDREVKEMLERDIIEPCILVYHSKPQDASSRVLRGKNKT